MNQLESAKSKHIALLYVELSEVVFFLVKVGKILNLIQKWFFASSGMLCLWGPTGGRGGGLPPWPPPVTLVSVTVQVLYGESHGMILAKVTFFFHFILSKVLCVGRGFAPL